MGSNDMITCNFFIVNKLKPIKNFYSMFQVLRFGCCLRYDEQVKQRMRKGDQKMKSNHKHFFICYEYPNKSPTRFLQSQSLPTRITRTKSGYSEALACSFFCLAAPVVGAAPPLAFFSFFCFGIAPESLIKSSFSQT